LYVEVSLGLIEEVTKVEDTTTTVEELRVREAVFVVVGIVVVEGLDSDCVTSVVALGASDVTSEETSCVASEVKSDVVSIKVAMSVVVALRSSEASDVS
jgi:hypothetical protein